MKKTVLTGLCVVLSACFGGGGQPTWVHERSADYPDTQYLTATGTAASSETAKSAALANLAKIFEVQVDESSRDEASAWQLTGEGEILQGGSQLTARYLDSYTTKLLEGASIAETWQGKDDKQYYALAVLSRSQLATRLKAEINKADRFIGTTLKRAKQSSEPLAAAQSLYRGQMALRQRELLQRDLQIVDATGRGVPAAWSSRELAIGVDKQLSRMRVATAILSGSLSELGGDLETALQAAVKAAGMQYAAEGSYVLEMLLEVEDQGQQEGWYWYRGALEVKLKAAAKDVVLASYRWPLKAPGQTQAQARVRLQDQIAKNLNTQLKSALLSFGQAATD